jgi:3-deoxy-7-phosphoheptulonate synthase
MPPMHADPTDAPNPLKTNDWSPASWRGKPIVQQPKYRDAQAVEAALNVVRGLPPLVAPGEVLALREHIAKAGRGETFVLQGGDCAERFEDCEKARIEAKLKILLQMSLVLTWGARLPIVRVARMAGQYAKPRSADTEVIDGVELPSYRGDHVHSVVATPEAREPDPKRLIEASFRSAATLNYARALLDGGFADLHRPQHWDLGFVRDMSHRAEYEAIVHRLLDALDFMAATGVQSRNFETVELFTSHEGLLLPWEEAQTAPVGDRFFNLGAHMLWIGDRTRQLDGAHVEYFRGIENPIGIKVGPSLNPSDLQRLLERIEPENRPGRVTLITRLGASGAVETRLPALIESVHAAGRNVTWSCDPMHGNTIKTGNGFKTRNVDAILDELRQTFATHDACGSRLGGVHFELTGDDVTECIGGPQRLSENDLTHNYETFCDPRLNYAQSLEMAFLVARHLQGRRR